MTLFALDYLQNKSVSSDKSFSTYQKIIPTTCKINCFPTGRQRLGYDVYAEKYSD